MRVSASAEIKEAVPERKYSDVFGLSVKYIQRVGSLSKELKSMKRNKPQQYMLNSFAPDTRICMHASVFAWPVHAE